MRGLVVVEVVVLAAGCGRVGFGLADATEDGALAGHDAAMPPDAVLWLPMDDAPASGLVRDAARDHTVTCTACPAPVGGRIGGGYRFERNSDNYLVVPFSADLDASGGYTIAAWVLVDTLPSSNDFACLVSKPIMGGDKDSYALCIQPDGSPLFYSGNASAHDYLTGGQLQLSIWHHVAMSWDGTTKRGYVDGIGVATSAVAIAADTSEVLIAADRNVTTTLYKLTGVLDDVLVYGRALADAEIARLAAP